MMFTFAEGTLSIYAVLDGSAALEVLVSCGDRCAIVIAVASEIHPERARSLIVDVRLAIVSAYSDIRWNCA